MSGMYPQGQLVQPRSHLTLSQPGWADSAHHIGTVAPKFSQSYILVFYYKIEGIELNISL